MSARRLDLVVVGDCCPDLVVRGANVRPAFGDVEQIVDDAPLVIGGSAAITACGAARLGARTALCSLVGDDVYGEFMRAKLTERGVDTTGIVTTQSASTGISIILAAEGERAILTALGTIAKLEAEHVDLTLLAEARHLHVTPFFLLAGLRPGLGDLLQTARSMGLTTSLDTNWDPTEQWDGGLSEVLAAADYLFVNGAEASWISGESDAAQAAAALSALGPTAVVKLGRDGALAHGPTGVSRCPAGRPTAVVDTVGAGDSFNAGFLVGRLAGKSIPESLAIGCRCGTLSTRTAGGTDGQATMAEVEAAE